MINVIKSILFDCGYENNVQTEIEFETIKYGLNIFKNKNVESHIFIVLQILESQLVSLSSNEEFVIEIATFFRESNIYVPDMDKNTSLVYCVESDIRSDKMDRLKVKIEDDPFYFKKYVLTYSDAEANEFKKLCKQYGKSSSEFIQTYILDADNFNKFKKNADNEKIYRLVSELLVKIPIIPISFKTQGEIKSVSDYMLEIQKCNSDEIEKLDRIIESLSDLEENNEQLVDKILEDWGSLNLEEENE